VLASTEARRSTAKRMGNTAKGDGYKYRGRGYVQLTWKSNYQKAGDFLGLDLVNSPELSLDQSNATKIMCYGMEKGVFTGKKFSHYFSTSNYDFFNARRIINGTDKASTIEAYADIFLNALRAAK
jgi:predicted chitinase